MYEDILQEQPDHAGAWHLLGVARQQQGQVEEAVACISRALRLDDSKAVYHNNFGVALRAAGRLNQAQQAFERALSIRPDYADAHSNLGLSLMDQGRAELAINAFRQALRLRPEHPDALFNCANLLQELERLDEAIRLYRQALETQPTRVEVHNNLGNALLAQQRPPEAEEHYRQAIALLPDHAEAHLNLGAALADQAMLEEASSEFEQAASLRPDKPLWSMRSLGLCPAVFQSVEELDRFRRGLEDRLDAAAGCVTALDRKTLCADAFSPSFYLSHHGRDNRPLKEKFAAIFEPHFPRENPPLRPQGKARVGFLVTQKHEGGFLRGTGGIIERLDPERFQPVVLCSQAVLQRCRRGIHRNDVEYVGFPNRFELAANRIKAAGCDILYHWQVGTDPLNYLLPFARLAPVQCTGWGTHGTSGIRALDYYTSSKYIESKDAQEHYSESLYLCDSFGTWQRRIPAPPKTERSHFGLPANGSLYVAPHRLAKIHPDMDELFAGILDTDPDAWIVLLKGKHERDTVLLRQRFARTIGAAANRIVFLPNQKAEDFHRLLSLADVMLDAPHYSAGLMSYDAISCNLPIVTLPGMFNVGRYALGVLRWMRLEDELVASSPADYIQKAVQLGTNPDYRRSVRSMIAERGDALFEDAQSVHDHERFFEYALDRGST